MMDSDDNESDKESPRCAFSVLKRAANKNDVSVEEGEASTSSNSGKKNSIVWKYFRKNDNSEDATCKLCPSIIKCKGSSTSAMTSHLKRKHKITETVSDTIGNKTVNPISNTDNSVTPKKPKLQQQCIQSYVKKESLSELLAKCAAKDGFSFKSITNSLAIQEFITKRGFPMPKSETTVKNLVLRFYEEKRDEMKTELTELKIEKKFSITVDEWTDIKSKRYLNVTLHTNEKCFKLGLNKISGSCDAATTEILVREKLMEFGINLESDVVASTHDGASVMQKYGRIIPVESQLCYNHAIHLAVIEVFYKRHPSNDAMDSDEIDDENSDIDSDKFVLESDSNIFFDTQAESVPPVYQPEVKDIINHIRQVSKFFRYSPVRNSILQKHVVEKEGKELNLLLDCKTRWNSLVPMIERFLKLNGYIKKALTDLGKTELIKDEFIPFLKEIRGEFFERNKTYIFLLVARFDISF